MFRILAMAGGGLRGAFAIGFLEAIERRLGGSLWDHFDLIAGTSTGAITASALCRGTTAKEMRAFYEKHAAAIFHPRPPRTPKRAFAPLYPLARNYVQKRIGRNLDHFFGSRYCPDSLEASMVEGFADETMSDARCCRLIIPAVNLTDGVTCIFRSPHLSRPREEYRWKIKDVILAATAAPTYFPHKVMPDGKDYADGGLWAIDPGVVAISEAARIRRCQTEESPAGAARGPSGEVWPSPEQAAFDSTDIHLLSLGTGKASYSLAAPGSDAGMLFWSKHVADVMSISQVQGTELPLKIFLGDRYRPYNFELRDPSWSMDNVDMIDELFAIGNESGDQAFGELEATYFATKVEPPRYYTEA